MIVVTGGAGFIGSNLVHTLNAQGEDQILIVDRLGENFWNLSDLRFCDFMEPEEFLRSLDRKSFPTISRRYSIKEPAPIRHARTAAT